MRPTIFLFTFITQSSDGVNSYEEYIKRLKQFLDSILDAPEEDFYNYNLCAFLEMGSNILVNDSSFLLNCIDQCLEKIEKHFGGRNNLPYSRVAAIK